MKHLFSDRYRFWTMFAIVAIVTFFACRSNSTSVDIGDVSVEHEEPADETYIEPGLGMSALAAPTRRMPPPFVIPRPTTVIESADTDALYLRGSTQGTSSLATLYRVTGDGRASIISDMPPASHQAWVVRDCVLEGARLWGMRRYRIGWGSLIEHCLVQHVQREHGTYDHPGPGEYTIRHTRYRNCGAQGVQLRLSASPTSSDPDYLATKTILLEDVQVLECGLARGAGRAGFGISVKKMGPNTTVTLRNVFVQTIDQVAVKVYNGKPYDSFGAICVEECGVLRIEGGYVEMKNPDRKAIQLFDFATKSQHGGSPREVYIDGLELANQDLILRADDTGIVRITNPRGSGRIWLQRWINGAWKTDTKPINWTAGYSQG